LEITNITVEICGMSGEGTIAAGAILNGAAGSAGMNVLAFDSYPSEIRGFGKCVTHARFGEEPVLTQGDAVDILVSLHDDYSSEQIHQLRPGSVVIFDNRPPQAVAEGRSLVAKLDPTTIHYGVPLMDLSQEAMSSRRGRNLVALGALAALFDLPSEAFTAIVKKKFYKASEAVQAGNLRAFELGMEYARRKIEKVDALSFGHMTGESLDVELVSGHQAVARACVDQHVALYAGYPITPATPIMEYLARELPKSGGAVVQMEDEIASIGCVVGAGYGGKRAVTATSGPGLSLMSEVINLAVMAEVPSLIINAMRGGPSTGLPTKTEQSDLNICVYGGSGDSPRIVLAPANVEESYRLTELALWLAEKYQTPVILTYDFFLANRVESVPLLKADEQYFDGNLWAKAEADAGADKRFKRYSLTESGISPRSVPGMAGLSHPATGLEHSEHGLPAYGTENHLEMTEKRWQKIEGALSDTPAPQRFGSPDKVKVGVLTWGSSVGCAKEAVELACEKGVAAAGLAVTTLWPFHTEQVKRFIDEAQVVLCPEGNRWGQFANLVSARTGRAVVSMPFPTGMPLTTGPILERILTEAKADG
jgi:2-oxoglutarate ferredoxin oxidoreductase subunit alpha